MTAGTSRSQHMSQQELLDAHLASLSATESSRTINTEYEADGRWLWGHWQNTVLSLTAPRVIITCAQGGLLLALLPQLESAWLQSAADGAPRAEEWESLLSAISTSWNYVLTFATFLLTFFLSQTTAHQNAAYTTIRQIQGRAHDVNYLLSLHAARGEEGDYTPEARELLLDVARYVRLASWFFWASRGLPLREGERSAHANELLTPEGLQRLVHTEHLQQAELAALLKTAHPPARYAWVALEWAGLRAVGGHASGVVGGGAGFETVLLEKLCALRGAIGTVTDLNSNRMSSAYVAFVQNVIDFLVAASPLALIHTVGTFAVPVSGVITLIYHGLLELGKSFLDPFGSRGEYPNESIRIEVLIHEMNEGSMRWMKAAAGRRPWDGVRE
jgi:hypothetical protein